MICKKWKYFILLIISFMFKQKKKNKLIKFKNKKFNVFIIFKRNHQNRISYCY